MAGTSSQCCGKVLRRGSFITVGQFTTPRSPTTLSYTNQRCTGFSKATAICALSVVSRSSGIFSPNFAFDMRLVQLSLCSWACESQLISPYLIFMALWSSLSFLRFLCVDHRLMPMMGLHLLKSTPSLHTHEASRAARIYPQPCLISGPMVAGTCVPDKRKLPLAAFSDTVRL